MVSIRRAEMHDLQHMQHCSLLCLPQIYTFKQYLQHGVIWPQLQYVSEDINSGKIVGYVLAKHDEEDEEEHGHITSLSILRTHRKLGLANQVMLSTHRDMDQIFESPFVSLHVRVSNKAALSLYRDKLGYETFKVEEKYYSNQENAFYMRKWFKIKTAKET